MIKANLLVDERSTVLRTLGRASLSLMNKLRKRRIKSRTTPQQSGQALW